MFCSDFSKTGFKYATFFNIQKMPNGKNIPFIIKLFQKGQYIHLPLFFFYKNCCWSSEYKIFRKFEIFCVFRVVKVLTKLVAISDTIFLMKYLLEVHQFFYEIQVQLFESVKFSSRYNPVL